MIAFLMLKAFWLGLGLLLAACAHVAAPPPPQPAQSSPPPPPQAMNIADDDLSKYFLAVFPIAFTDPRAGLPLFQHGYELAKKRGDKVNEALFLSNLGALAAWVADYPKALEQYGRALQLQRTLPKHEEVEARILSQFANVYVRLGDYGKALQYLKDAIALARKINEVWDQSTFLTALGEVYGKLGDPEKMLEVDKEALLIAENIPDKQRQGEAWINIGYAHKELGEFDEALKALDKALAISRVNNDFPRHEDIEVNKGETLLAMGNKEAAFEIFNRIHHYNVRDGLMFLMEGKIEEAKESFQGARRGGIAFRNSNQLAASFIGLGLTYEKLHEFIWAREAFDSAIAEIERQRELVPLTSRSSFLAGKEDDLFYRLEAYQGRARVAATAADGFFWAETTKARAFVESLSERFRHNSPELPAELARSESALNQKLLSLSSQLNLAFVKNQMNRYNEIDKELRAAKQAQAALIEKLRKEFPKYASLVYPQAVAAEAVPLHTQEVLLEYEVTPSGTMLFVLRPGKTAERIDIPAGREVLGGLVKKFRRPFEDPLDDEGRFRGDFDSESGKALYDFLIKPVVEHRFLEPGSEIVVVPDESLGLLPFEALTPNGDHHYLGDDFDIAYAQSATALSLSRTQGSASAAGKGAFVLADPVFAFSDSRVHLKGQRDQFVAGFDAQAVEKAARLMGASEGNGFPRLPETGKLAQATAKLFGKESASLVGFAATKERLFEENLKAYRLLVFATHGILESDISYIKEPALVLSQVNATGEGVDGFLKSSDVLRLELDADLVALTACKTGLGRNVSGNGVEGLGRSFQYAGARNVLVSLWSVAEKSSTLLAENVFARIKEGDAPRKALRKAREVLRQQGYDHPFYWSSFILVGG